ncbi:glutamine amidotransferase [Propioniciclava soli]|uniref:Glutamine amidotransferase n=1 Tax=Propioniciclava soli TaxID=2775081 RepID=A0ABZ3C9Z3_9ACTN
MKPFLHLSIRDHDEAAAAEYDALCTFTGLEPDALVSLRAEHAPLPDVDVADYAGVIVGGGQYNASDATKSAVQQRVEDDLGRVLDAALDHDVPFLGLCYGVGLITQRLGGVVDKSYGERPGAVAVSLTDAAASDPVFAGLPATFDAFVGHKEACAALPPDAVLLATGDACPVQAFRVGRRAYATQFHPELDVERLVERLRIYAHAGYFHPDELPQLIEETRASGVREVPSLILRNFVSAFAG